MGITRETDADAAEDVMSAHLGGQQAYLAGKPYDPGQSTIWCGGWMAAAGEARRVALESKTVLEELPLIRDALEQAHAAIRQLMPAKPRPRQTQLAAEAIDSIVSVLPKIELPAAGTAPPRAPASMSQPGSRARGGKRGTDRR